jgi:transcriptional regulator with XRE-family HTH domain
MINELKVSEITLIYRNRLAAEGKRIINQKEFGEHLSQGLLNTGLSRNTISLWEKGRSQPDWEFLLSLYTYHFSNQDNWQFQFAVDCLRAMKPETFATGIINLTETEKIA